MGKQATAFGQAAFKRWPVVFFRGIAQTPLVFQQQDRTLPLGGQAIARRGADAFECRLQMAPPISCRTGHCH